jgi:hypothetical protein
MLPLAARMKGLWQKQRLRVEFGQEPSRNSGSNQALRCAIIWTVIFARTPNGKCFASHAVCPMFERRFSRENAKNGPIKRHYVSIAPQIPRPAVWFSLVIRVPWLDVLDGSHWACGEHLEFTADNAHCVATMKSNNCWLSSKPEQTTSIVLPS